VADTQTDIVRKYPHTIKASEVIRLARKEYGVKIKPGLVYSVRSLDRKFGPSKLQNGTAVATPASPAPAPVVKRRKAAAALASAPKSQKEDDLRKLVLQIGVENARRVIDSVESLTWS